MAHQLRIPRHETMDRFAPSDEPPKTVPKKRRCRKGGCVTILNSYHAGFYCYAHEPRLALVEHAANWRLRAEDLVDLLEDAA